MSALVWIFAASFAIQASADDLTGTVTSIETVGGKVVAHFRTATEDIDLDFAALPAPVRDQLASPSAKTSRIQLTASGGQIVSRTNVPFGVRADCSELPVSVRELDKLAKDPKTTSMVDFLKKIPPGTLQGFTFVTNSKSAQRGNETPPGQVSPMWPRALRASIDGSLTISFVCDPQNPAFGKVEVIEFNKKTREFETTEWDFGSPSKPTPPQERVKKDPSSCRECHAGSTTNLGGTPHPSIKPNWPEYFFWGDCMRSRGITLYGASDDNMGGAVRYRFPTSDSHVKPGCNDAQDAQSVQDANADFKNFRTTQKNNDCFNTLPWAKLPPGAENAPIAKDSTQDYRFYPYAVRAQDTDPQNHFNYSLRTNARFTDGYSHYLADRNAALLKQDPDYELMKYYLVMEEGGCITQQDRDDIAKMLGSRYKFTTKDPTNVLGGSDYSLPQSQPILYAYGKKAGVADLDWTMEFKEKDDPAYNAVMFEGAAEGGGDSKIFNATVGNIFREIREENPTLRDAFPSPFIRGVTADFGERFSCIDDIAGRIKGDLRGQGPRGAFCTALRAENDKRMGPLLATRKACDDCTNVGVSPEDAEKLNQQVRKLAAELDKGAAARGREHVKAGGKGKCVACHSSKSAANLPSDLLFIPEEGGDPDAEAAARARIKARFAEGDFLGKVKRQLVEKKGMPPGNLGRDLTDQDRNDIISYIQSLIVN